MEQYANSIVIVLLFALIIFWYSQTKFKNKMLCYFLRPNKQRIKKFVPLYSNYVIFDRGKYGVQRYNVDPNCIILEWYTGGINKLFPTLVPTLDFEWHNPNPRNPATGTVGWRTPEVEYAAFQGQSYVGMARAMAQQAGMKRNKIMELIPLIILGVVIIIGFVMYQYMGSLNEQMGALQQMINLKK
jgi:hypothetical protein